MNWDIILNSAFLILNCINFPLEITVKVVNINVDKDNKVLKRCEVLEQYSEFVELVRRTYASGVEEPFKVAIEIAIKTGILKDYLERKATEVINMILTEYDYDTDIAVQREEAYEEGLSKGISQGAEQAKIETAKNLLSEKISVEQVARCTGLPLKTVENLAK